MSLNKKILALAIAGLLPAASYAYVDINTPANGTPVVFANEFNVDPIAGQVLTNAPGELTNKVSLGFGVSAQSIRYFRYDFGTAKLKTKLSGGNFTAEDALGASLMGLGADAPTFTVVSGGNVGDTFVIVQVTAGTGATASRGLFQDDRIVFNPGVIGTGVDALTAFNKNPQAITYALYETGAAAAGKVSPLSGPVTNNWYTWSNSVAASCTQLASAQIDVTAKNKFIGNATNTPLFSLSLNLTPNILIPTTGLAPVALSDFLGVNTQYKVTGDFTGLATPALAGPLPAYIAPFVTDATKTFATANFNPAPNAGYTDVPLTVFSANDPTKPMIESTYSVQLIPQPGALAATLDPNFGKLGVCGSLQYSGSSDRVDLVLTPGATNKQWVRITNPSNTGGAVNVSVWNDAGVQVDFPLSDVKVGPAPGVNLPLILNQYSSTPVIATDAFYAAAQAKNPAFTVGTGIDGAAGKLRIEVRGAFGDNHVDGVHSIGSFVGKPSTVRLKNGIYIQAVSSATLFQSH